MDEVVIRRNPMFDRQDQVAWLPPLLFRLCLGVVFATHGWAKLGSLPETATYLHALGIGNSLFFAEVLGWSEFIGGTLLIVGLFTRLASIPLAVTMIVALLTAKAPEAAQFLHLLMMGEFLFLLALIDLMVTGAGRVSLDYLIWRGTADEDPIDRGTRVRIHHPAHGA
jgi:putative oxidoreductase